MPSVDGDSKTTLKAGATVLQPGPPSLPDGLGRSTPAGPSASSGWFQPGSLSRGARNFVLGFTALFLGLWGLAALFDPDRSLRADLDRLEEQDRGLARRQHNLLAEIARIQSVIDEYQRDREEIVRAVQRRIVEEAKERGRVAAEARPR